MKNIQLREADRLEVISLVDNYSDAFLESAKGVKRQPLIPGTEPLAEHGLSYLLKVYSDSEEHQVLLDAGVSSTCFLHNVTVFGIDLAKIESMVLSHGHFDHFGGLMVFLDKADKGTTLVFHPDAFLERRLNVPSIGLVQEMPGLDEMAIKATGSTLRKAKEASTLASGYVLVTGEVERVTDFERGFLWAEARVDGQWMVDPFRDDQGVVVNVKNKGLVIFGGCSHAGIINIVRYARKLTGTEKVHAVLGGFHLGGPLFEPIIGRTIEEMKKIGPDFVVPSHCTGWKAINQFASKMPEQFRLNSVGTTYVF